jgi:hypothetical protein
VLSIGFLFPANPSVSNVHILGNLEEGNTVNGVGTYFGGKEGQSKLEWYREDLELG